MSIYFSASSQFSEDNQSILTMDHQTNLTIDDSERQTIEEEKSDVEKFAEAEGISENFFNTSLDKESGVVNIPMEKSTRVFVIEGRNVERTRFSPHVIAIQGEPQSGKTLCMVLQSLRMLDVGTSVVVALRDFTDDAVKTAKRFRDVFAKYALTSGTTFPVYSTSETRRLVVPEDNPCVVICLSNISSLNKVKSAFGTETDFALVVDEADYVAMPGTNDTFCDTKVILKEMSILSSRTIYVTATMFDVLVNCDLDITHDALYVLNPPNTYNNLKTFCHQEIEGESKFTTASGNIVEDTPYIKTYLSELESKPILRHGARCTGSFRLVEKPNISLILCTDKLRPQLVCAEYIHDNYEIDVIVQDGTHGIRIFTHKKIEGCTLRGKFYDFNHTIGVQQAIQIFKDMKSFTPIAIFAGSIAGRSVSYVSADFGETFNEGLAWRITEAFMVFAKSTTVPEMIQKVTRGCCTQGDGLGFRLYSTIESFAKVFHGYCATREAINLARTGSLASDEPISDCIRTVKLNRKKLGGIPAQRLGKGSFRLETCKEDDGGESLAEYRIFEDEEDVKKGKTGRYVDDGGVKLVVEEWIAGTVQKKMYQLACKVLLEKFGTDKWVVRSDIVDGMIKIHERKDIFYHQTHLKSLVDLKSKIATPSSTGLKMQKRDNLWYLRID
jgi:hypothetical protein